jgi:hypothetical protein
MNEREIFIAAIAIDDPDERARFIGAQSAGNPALRGRLSSLLQTYG